MPSSNSNLFSDLYQAEIRYKQLKTSRITSEDKLQQASLREQRLKKELAQAENQLGKDPVGLGVEKETSLAKTLTELAIQLRQQQCLQEAMKGEIQHATQQASQLKLDIEMLHSKFRSQFGTAIVTTPRGKMNNSIQGNNNSSSGGKKASDNNNASTTEFSTSIITMVGEIAGLQQQLFLFSNNGSSNASSDSSSSENRSDSSSSSSFLNHHPLVPSTPTSEEVPSFSSWDKRASTLAANTRKQLQQCHQQLVSSLNVICNSCTNLSDDKSQWGAFVDMIDMAFYETCKKLLQSAVELFVDSFSGNKRPREVFAIQARLNQTIQVVFSPSQQEIGVAIRKAVYDRLLNEVFKFPHLHSILTKKAETKFSSSSQSVNDLLSEENIIKSKYLEIDRFIDRFEKDMQLAHKDILGEYGFAFSSDIVNLSSAQLFNTQLKLESSFQDRFPLARGGLQVNCSSILDTTLQLLAMQRKKAKEAEQTKRIESFLINNDNQENTENAEDNNGASLIINFSTFESCRAPAPRSIIPNRSQQDDDLEKLLGRIPSITSKNAVVSSPFLPEVWNRVAAPEHTPTVIVPIEPPPQAKNNGNSNNTGGGRSTPPPAGRIRAIAETTSPVPTCSTPTSIEHEDQQHRNKTKQNEAEDAVQMNKHENNEDEVRMMEVDDEEEREILAAEKRRKEAQASAQRLSNQMRQSAGFFSGGGTASTTIAGSNNINNNMPPLHPNSSRPSTGPVSKSNTTAAKTSSPGEVESEVDAVLNNSNVSSSIPVAPQSLTPNEKVFRRRASIEEENEDRSSRVPFRQQPLVVEQEAKSPEPSPTSVTSNTNNNHNKSVSSSLDYRAGSASSVTNNNHQNQNQHSTSTTNSNNNNYGSQRKSPTPPNSSTNVNNNNNRDSSSNNSSYARPLAVRTKLANRSSNNNNTNNSNDLSNSQDADEQLESLKRKEQENLDKMRNNERKFQQLQKSLEQTTMMATPQKNPNNTSNNDINNSNVSTSSIHHHHHHHHHGAQTPQSARNILTSENSNEREVVDPRVLQMIRDSANARPTNSVSAPSANQRHLASIATTSESIFAKRPKLSAYTQQQLERASQMQQQQQNNNGNTGSSPEKRDQQQYVLKNSSTTSTTSGLPSLTSSANSHGQAAAMKGRLDSTVQQKRAEREFAKRAAEAETRREEMQQQMEEERVEKELARKLKSIEKSSDSKNQSMIRAASREGGSDRDGGVGSSTSGTGGLDLPPLASGRATGYSNNNNNNNIQVSSYYSSGNQIGGGSSSSRPSSATRTPYSLSPEKSNNSGQNQNQSSGTSNGVAIASSSSSSTPLKQGTATGMSSSSSSALRRKLSLPSSSSSSPSVPVVAASSSAFVNIIEAHEAASLSLLEIYKLACQRMTIKPNSGVVRMLPKNPGEFISSINLDTNYIGNRGIAPLLQVLRVNRGLQFLNLRDNNLESPQISQLCDMLINFPTSSEELSQLNLSNNPVTPAGATSLCELIQARRNLTSVIVKDTLIQGKTAEQISELCLRNSMKKKQQDVEEL